jgi:ABC-type sulfate/molybdate transport systems ATPase subunit
VADEPVASLDVSIRNDILKLMVEHKEKLGVTYLFITHDLSLAWVISDRIAVMYLGRIVETGDTEEVVANPQHPTKALISVILVRIHGLPEHTILIGDANPANILRAAAFTRAVQAHDTVRGRSEDTHLAARTTRQPAVVERGGLTPVEHSKRRVRWGAVPGASERGGRECERSHCVSHRGRRAVLAALTRRLGVTAATPSRRLLRLGVAGCDRGTHADDRGA